MEEFATKEYSYGLTPEHIKQLDEAIDQELLEVVPFLISNLDDAELADYLAISTYEIRTKLIRIIKEDFHPNVLLAVDTHLLPEIIEQIGYDATAKLMAELEIDNAVYILERLDQDLQNQILELLPSSKVSTVKEMLSYPENSAGRIMNPRIIKVMEYWTIEQTINFLRNNRNIPDNYYQIFILNFQHAPIGYISLSKILKSNPKDIIGETAEHDLKFVAVDTPNEEISYLFQQYELTALPVVNHQNRLVGVIDVDDMIEVVAEETEEDYLKLAGVAESDIYSRIIDSSLKRLPWLVLNLFGSLLTSHMISYFGGEIEKMVILASIMPIVASVGGNAGTQTVTLIIRGIATKTILDANAFRVIRKEVLISLTNSLLISAIGGGLIYLIMNNLFLSLIFSSAIICNFIVAGLMGSAIPIFFNKIKVDPAVSSSIFLTALTDITGFCSFLILAKIFLLN
ncbi:magnesium transporter [Rickettsiales endosymbiont of Stachyamoeba lipophora]|uniref:magnesium transporter n=1 Tax=Rickettsiales endosymbiont of Stachyamoeba lipophora TaxID=2486578 RepID=UPI000F64D57B|nr:magnesium transporter [Rickettsiales endosymbiont of Stachyamoeba lipophora]AZL15845.1 magnesium transporter [Rickettsiales endosymbiont of Stachyamoeba lipophora]